MNFTGKYEVIESLLKTYDELDRLRTEIERLKSVNDDAKSINFVEDEEDPRAYQKSLIMKYGRKKIVEESLSYWNNVSVRRDKNGQLVVQEFSDWRNVVVNKIPDYMSREDFFVLMDTELRETYASKKRKAMDELALDKLVESERESNDE